MMMKTQNELNALKKEFEELNAKLAELTDEEMEQVSGGLPPFLGECPNGFSELKASVCVYCEYFYLDMKGYPCCKKGIPGDFITCPIPK